MRIANADKLIHHFEHTVMVKNFSAPEIVTIIKRFSGEVDEGKPYVFHKEGDEIIVTDCIEKWNLDNIFGGTQP